MKQGHILCTYMYTKLSQAVLSGDLLDPNNKEPHDRSRFFAGCV